jgi:hypothetical protein
MKMKEAANGRRPYFFGGATCQCIVNSAPKAPDKAKMIAKAIDDLRKRLAFPV